MTIRRVTVIITLGLLAGGCPEPPQLKPTRDQAAKPPPPKAEEKPAVEVTGRPTFDPDKPPPCESHTACYLAAKDAHQTGKRAGYLLALDNCEYYRGSYQLEKFYGLCLLILADCYRHLNNYQESRNAYQRFLDTQPDDPDLALQAKEGIEEVKAGEKEAGLYRRYLQAVSLVSSYNHASDPARLEEAKKLLSSLHAERPDWILDRKVTSLLEKLTPVQPEQKKEE